MLRPGVRDRCSAALAIIRRLGSVAEVLADRAYTTAKPEHWARPLRTMGIVETKDLHETQRGVRPGPVPDTIWLDGRLHSAAIPTDLSELDPPRPADSATTMARRRGGPGGGGAGGHSLAVYCDLDGGFDLDGGTLMPGSGGPGAGGARPGASLSIYGCQP